MNDTKPSMEARWSARLLAKSGGERMAMGCAMFDDAKALVTAGVRAANPGADEREIKRQVFLGFYGEDFPPEKREKILAALFGPRTALKKTID